MGTEGIHSPPPFKQMSENSGIQMTIDTYSHVAPGIQEAAARQFDEILDHKQEKGRISIIG